MTGALVLNLFILLTISGAIYAAFVRHTLYCIIALGVTLFGVAGVFLSLGSPFVAAMQVLIYIGGISVAMVFALMLSVSLATRIELSPTKVFASVLAASLFFGSMAWLILSTDFPLREEPAPREAWSLSAIGHAFLTDYNLVFEGLSLVLLLAIIAAIIVAKKDPATS